MAVPYYWFDLLADTPSPLLRWPAMIMDRTLQQYMQLSPAEALARMQTLLATTCEAGGVFTLLLHNDSLSESGEWQGWRPAIREMIRLTTALPAPTFI
jgi:hypothetical protein